MRDWVRTGRIQYSSKQIVGDRWALLGHAAGFIDPLYSKGLYISLTSVAILAHHLLQAHKDGAYERERFLPLEETTLAFLHSNDRLVANSYKSWGNTRLWTQYSVLWLLGAYTELLKLFSIRLRSIENGKIAAHRLVEELQQLKLSGGGFSGYDRVADQIDAVIEVVDPSNDEQVAAVTDQIQAVFNSIEWMPLPFQAVLQGRTHLPKNKLRLDLFRKRPGVLAHWGVPQTLLWGTLYGTDRARDFAEEMLRYSKPALAWQRRQRREPTLHQGGHLSEAAK